MKYKVEFKDWKPDAAIRDRVEKEIARIERLVTSLPEESRFLRLIISRNTTRTLYRVSIRFDLPGPDIAAVEERHDVAEAIHDAFAEIRRELERYRDTLTHAHEYKRPARREALRRPRRGG